jgi:hypothetical protein
MNAYSERQDMRPNTSIWKYSKEWWMLAGFTIEESLIMERNAIWFIQQTRPNYDYDHQCELEEAVSKTE